MAIDLTVLSIRQPLALCAMLPEFAAILSEILGYAPIGRRERYECRTGPYAYTARRENWFDY
jgi:hypothetical protein